MASYMHGSLLETFLKVDGERKIGCVERHLLPKRRSRVLVSYMHGELATYSQLGQGQLGRAPSTRTLETTRRHLVLPKHRRHGLVLLRPQQHVRLRVVPVLGIPLSVFYLSITQCSFFSNAVMHQPRENLQLNLAFERRSE